MRIRLFHSKEFQENKIDVYYQKIDHTLKQILEIANYPLPNIRAQKGATQHQLDIADVCYIETVNKEIFIYTTNEMYTTLLTLQSISEQFETYGLVRVNKYTILNVYRLKTIKLGKQMKHIVTMDSGEKIELSRSYREFFFNYLDSIYGRE